MSLTDSFIESTEIHPIDLVETLAAHLEWDFDRMGEDRIVLNIVGQWREYSVTLAWSARDEVLRLISTYDLAPPADRTGALYEALNLANDQLWEGNFTWWRDQQLMVWRYGLVLAGGQCAGPEQIEQMLGAAIAESERFYPAFQLACWGGETPAEAMGVAMAQAYGRA